MQTGEAVIQKTLANHGVIEYHSVHQYIVRDDDGFILAMDIPTLGEATTFLYNHYESEV